jgi:hypothetical protein
VRSQSDAALFDLLSTSAIVPTDVDAAPFGSTAFKVARSVEPVFGKRGIAQCVFMPVIAIATSP